MSDRRPADENPTGVIARRIAPWCANQDVELCVLFGSRAEGRDRPDSDLDLAVWPSGGPVAAERLLAWRRELTELLAIPVELIAVGPRLDPVLGLQVARQGLPLYERSPGLWPARRLQLWQLFQDSLPFLRASRERLREFAEEARRGA